jgi:hypothetical protein
VRQPRRPAGVPLPRHDLRNGRLNQTAYSLFLFIRDLAGGDIVGWIDERLASVDPVPASDRPARLRQALLEPLSHIYGVSNKVLALALAELLLAGDAKRPAWIEAGAVMIAVDTLVHNSLHRTGILRELHAEHAYGPGCYAPGGCAAITERIAGKIDARRFNPAFPENFPRFVQRAIWRFCAEAGLNRCNGNHIDDRAPCEQTECPVWRLCDRVPLKPGVTGRIHAQNESGRSSTEICCSCELFLICSWCCGLCASVAVLATAHDGRASNG